jgi:hypothetical protein
MTKALVETALEKGMRADADILFSVLLNVARPAYRASLPNIASAIVPLAAAFTSNPLVGMVAELVDEVVQALPIRWGSPSPSSTAAAATTA